MQDWVKPMRVYYALIGLVYALMLLLIEPQEPAVFFLWLLSLMVTIIRLRFAFNEKFIIVDIVLIVLLYVVFETTLFLLLPIALILIISRHYLVVLLIGVAWVYDDFGGIESLLYYGMGVTLAFVISFWMDEAKRGLMSADHYREKVYTLEKERTVILDEQDELSRVSVLSERDRIAQKLHDDLGHELTGALMALRAFEVEAETLKSNESFQVAKNKLERSVSALRDTVSQTRPEEAIGYERFKNMMDGFNSVKVVFSQSGDLSLLSIAHWHVLLAVLKEGLTNVLKHAQATLVEVDLQADDAVVKLVIKNDFPKKNSHGSGLGLIYMRRRVEAIGGVISTNHSFMFTLRCVIPLKLEE